MNVYTVKYTQSDIIKRSYTLSFSHFMQVAAICNKKEKTGKEAAVRKHGFPNCNLKSAVDEAYQISMTWVSMCVLLLVIILRRPL